jgi:hypothetical protein
MEPMWLYSAATGISVPVSDTDGVFYGRNYYTPDQVIVSTYKIRYLYCNQKQSVSNNCCEYCGAPLPDY